ncbi:hypothetical protein HKX48_005565 [Thoreauomyces humboldtii]|nr:hypothetical protein HKX48_005565 [Thoreauomyces humboldtii]
MVNQQGNAEKHVATSFASKVEDVTFSVLYSMYDTSSIDLVRPDLTLQSLLEQRVHDNDVNSLLSVLITLFEDMQLISFAFNPIFYDDMPDWAPYITNPLSYRPHSYSGFLVLLGVVIGLVMLAVVSAVEVAMSFGSGKFAGISLYALKTLRLLTQLLGTILFIPVIEILFVAVTCSGPNNTLVEYPNHECFSGSNSALTIIVLFVLMVFVPYNVCMSAIYLDTSPNRSNKTARVPIGRLDTIYAISRILVTLVFTLSSSAVLRIAFLIPVTALLSVLIIRYQPFYIRSHNELRAALFMASAFAAVVALVSHVTKSPGKTLPIAAVVSVLVGAITGAATCRAIFRITVRRVYNRIQMKHKGLGKSMQDLGVTSGPNRQTTESLEDKAERGEGFDGIQAMRDLHTITGTRTRPKTIKVFTHPAEVELACRFVHDNRTPQALYIMEEIFGEGFDQFPRNSMLKLIYAGYLETYTSESQEPVYFVNLAKSLKPPFDARFFIFMQDRILEQSKRTEGLNSSTLNISSYVEFQTMQNGARRDHLATLIELRAFLSHVRSGQRGRDPKTYPIFLQRISEAEQRATDYYKKLIARWPKSKVLLRMYGSFLLQIKNEKETAAKYMMMAEEIEEIEMRMTSSAPIQRHGSMRSSPSTKVGASLAQQAGGRMHAQMDTGTRSDAIAGASGVKETREDSDDSLANEVVTVPEIVLSRSSIRNDQDEMPSREFPVVKNTSQLRRRMSMQPRTDEDDEGMGNLERVGSGEAKGVGFNISPDMDDTTRLEGRMPSESAGGSTKSSEREAKLKVYNKMQLQTRLKAPVVELDRNQKLTTCFYLANIVVAFSIGLWSFSAAESSINGFVRGTRLSKTAIFLAGLVRDLTQISSSTDPVASRDVYDSSMASLSSLMTNYTTFYLPYLAQFYMAADSITLETSSYPVPYKDLAHTNAYEVAKTIHQYGTTIEGRDYSYFQNNVLQTDNTVRYFLDNVLTIAAGFDDAMSTGQETWIQSSMQNVYVLYGLLCLLVLSMLGWAYLVFWPMIRHSSDEQTRTLKMYAMIPKKALMSMLTEIEEQIESISDEMTAASQGVDENGLENPASSSGANVNNQSAAMAANRMINRNMDPDDLVKQSSIKKHVVRYASGLVVLALPGISLLLAPILRAVDSVNYAQTMSYTNQRRSLAQAVVFLGKESLIYDNTTWLPYEPLMNYRDRLSSLVSRQSDSITGTNCIATPSIGALKQVTLVSAPCQPACGNITAGIDAQISMFITAATDLGGYLAQGSPLALAATAQSNMLFMNEMLNSVVDNLNNMDTSFQSIILDGNSLGQTAMTIIFALTLVGTLLVYLLLFHATVKARLVEMECAVTLVFGIPETVIQAVPEIKRFIESGGMFADDGVRKRK